jgi:E3 ubiquitin-protein ligase DOA10
VKSDIFRYDFGQCRSSVSENGNSPKKLGFAFQFLWTIAYYIVSGLGLIGWLMFLLVLAPKLISFKMRRLLSWADESELLKTDRECTISGKVINLRKEVHLSEVSSSDTREESN